MIFDFLIKNEDNVDPDYFIYVRTALEPAIFKQLLAFIQFVSITNVCDKHTLSELELAKVINDLFKRAIIMKTTAPLNEYFTQINLLENYKEHYQKMDKLIDLINLVEESTLILYLHKLATQNGWSQKYDYLIKDEKNFDPDYFVYVQTDIKPDKFKHLLAFVQYTSESHVCSNHRLNELEAVSIINSLFSRVEVLSTSVPLNDNFIRINLLENYEAHWKCPDEIFYLVERIGENVLINSLKNLAIFNRW